MKPIKVQPLWFPPALGSNADFTSGRVDSEEKQPYGSSALRQGALQSINLYEAIIYTKKLPVVQTFELLTS